MIHAQRQEKPLDRAHTGEVLTVATEVKPPSCSVPNVRRKLFSVMAHEDHFDFWKAAKSATLVPLSSCRRKEKILTVRVMMTVRGKGYTESRIGKTGT